MFINLISPAGYAEFGSAGGISSNCYERGVMVILFAVRTVKADNAAEMCQIDPPMHENTLSGPVKVSPTASMHSEAIRTRCYPAQAVLL